MIVSIYEHFWAIPSFVRICARIFSTQKKAKTLSSSVKKIVTKFLWQLARGASRADKIKKWCTLTLCGIYDTKHAAMWTKSVQKRCVSKPMGRLATFTFIQFALNYAYIWDERAHPRARTHTNYTIAPHKPCIIITRRIIFLLLLFRFPRKRLNRFISDLIQLTTEKKYKQHTRVKCTKKEGKKLMFITL